MKKSLSPADQSHSPQYSINLLHFSKRRGSLQIHRDHHRDYHRDYHQDYHRDHHRDYHRDHHRDYHRDQIYIMILPIHLFEHCLRIV